MAGVCARKANDRIKTPNPGRQYPKGQTPISRQETSISDFLIAGGATRTTRARSRLSTSPFATSCAQAQTTQTTYDGNGQVPQQFVISGKAAARIHDHISINAETAEKLSKACEAIAAKNNSAVVVVVVDPYGLVVHEHRMDGEGWIQVNATEQKARTALRTRAPSHVLANRNAEDPFTNQNMAGYGLTTQEGGLPIIVNGQLIGAIGVGGIPPAERTLPQIDKRPRQDLSVVKINSYVYAAHCSAAFTSSFSVSPKIGAFMPLTKH